MDARLLEVLVAALRAASGVGGGQEASGTLGKHLPTPRAQGWFWCRCPGDAAKHTL